eukprot:scaffold225179_cov30-Tisochrysis_lutea.AAC.2
MCRQALPGGRGHATRYRYHIPHIAGHAWPLSPGAGAIECRMSPSLTFTQIKRIGGRGAVLSTIPSATLTKRRKASRETRRCQRSGKMR